MVFNIFVTYEKETKTLLARICAKKAIIKQKNPDLKIISIDLKNKKQLEILKKSGITVLPAIQTNEEIISGHGEIIKYLSSIVNTPKQNKSVAKTEYENYTKEILSRDDGKDEEEPIAGEGKVQTGPIAQDPPKKKPMEFDSSNNLPKPIPRKQNVEKKKKKHVDINSQSGWDAKEDAFLNNLASGHI